MSHTLTHDYLCIMHVSALVLCPCYRLLPAITLNVPMNILYLLPCYTFHRLTPR